MKKILLLSVILLSLFVGSFAQNVFDPNDPIVRYSSLAPYGSDQKPDSNIVGLQKWVANSTNGVSTGTGNFKAISETYKAYFINYYNTRLAFRVKYPKSFLNPDSANKKYPVALFLHGAGEVGCPSNGGIYNNEKQIALGGQLFATRVDNDQFDGFLVYPQLRSKDNGCWGEWGGGINANFNTIMTFIDSMSKYVRADIDRLFVFGLSGGGVGTLRMAEFYPTRVAKIAPTSAAGFPQTFTAFVHIPIWLATGGKDNNPSPDMALYTETKVNEVGGSIRRSLYPDLGHASWYRHWQEADFVKYMNETHKANPLIYFGRSEFCPTDAVNAKIGITAGFNAYEWEKDGVLIARRINNANTIYDNNSVASFTGNEITVKAFGTYRVRFRRVNNGQWSEWSPVPAVIKPKAVTQTPPIQIVGNRSKVVPALDGSTKVTLQLPPNFINYQWVRTTDNVQVASTQIFDAPPGSYKARYAEQYGCGTEYSPVFTVVSATGTPKPDAAKDLNVTAISQTELRLDWSENPNATVNETGFEVYRATKAGGPYSFVTLTDANIVTYLDTALIPNTSYYYIVRAVSETGAAAASNEASGKTEIDGEKPTAPTNLEYRGSTSTTVTLRWNESSDNAGIARYDIYANGKKQYSTTKTSFTVANLDSLTSYSFFVKAIDKAGNESPNSNQVIGFTHRQGLNYKYYHGTFSTLPNFNQLTPVSSGIMDTVNAGAGVRTRADNYAFMWEGKIYIPVSGTWTFETASDDGSKLYIDVPYSYNATALVNNDGAHGVQSRTGSIFLNQGYHSIVITFSEITGGEEMNLYWWNNVGLARERIPKNVFSIGDAFSSVALNTPSNLTATAEAYNKIKLTWDDNSSNESGFEIVRSTNIGGPFVPVVTTAANAVSYTDSGLNAATRYYYKIRAITSDGESLFAASYTEANWKFNNNYNESNGGTAASGSGTSFNSSDKAEGTHSLSFANNNSASLGAGNNFPSLGNYNQRTVALWIKPSSTSQRRMIFDIGGNDNGLALRINSGALNAGIASGSSRVAISATMNSGNGWNSNAWNHVAVVYNVNSLVLYINGNPVASNNSLPFTSITGNSASASALGAPNATGNANNAFSDGSYSSYTGLMDNLFIIRGALSQAEINNLRNHLPVAQAVATTLASPAPPAAPSALQATVLSTSAIQLKFNDNSSDETGFEIWRSSGDKSNNRKVATLPASGESLVTFTDTTLFANITYYYTVRATGVQSPSAFSAEVSGRTLNSKPEIRLIRDFTMKYGTTYLLPVKATDPDGETLNFSTYRLPSFATIQQVENGLMNISFSPGLGNRGTHTMSVYVEDGNNGKDTMSFILIVNTNDVPVIAPIAENIVMDEGAETSIVLSATDNQGTSKMTWSFSALPSFVSFVAGEAGTGTGTLLIKPGYSASGDYEMVVMVEDGYGAWSSKTINLSVQEKDPESTVRFDFRTTSKLPAGWNSINIAPPSFNHGTIFDSKTQATPITLTLTKGSVSSSSLGMMTGNNSGAFPDSVMRDIMTWGFNAGNSLMDTIIVKVAGLDKNKLYDFTFHSGYFINGDANSTTKFVIGSQMVSINYYQNWSVSKTISESQPNAAGEILITMIGDPNTARGGVLSAMVMNGYYYDGSTPAKPAGFKAAHVENDGVQMSWTDKAFNENGYYIYRSTERSGPYTILNPDAANRDSTAFTDNTTLQQTTYYYYVAGFNSIGIGASSDTVKVITGNNRPRIVLDNNLYVKTGAVTNIDFTVTDQVSDVLTVTIKSKPSFVDLHHLGGGSYRLVFTPNADHIGWRSLQLSAADQLGGVDEKTVSVTIADKNTRSVFVNLGGEGRTAPAPWNNWLGTRAAGSVLENLKDESNAVTPFSITAVSSWATINNMGHITGNNSGVFPDSVLQSGVSDIGGPRTIRFNGLDNNKRYNVVIFGSMNEGVSTSVEYSSGLVKDTLNARYNTNETANLNGLAPSSGQISIVATRLTGTQVSYLNAIVLEEYDPAQVSVMNPLNLYAEPFDRNSINLSWSDRTADEHITEGFVLERATDSLFTQNVVTELLPANTTNYRSTGLTANTRYWFRVRAKSLGGILSEFSNRAKAITPASIVLVNFNYTLPDAPYPWNNTFSSPSIEMEIEDLINQSGRLTGMTMQLTKLFNGEFTAGVNTGNNSGIVPDNALAANYWLDRTQVSQFKLTGLNHSRKYRIGFFGSSSSAGWFKGNYTSTYTINGRTVYLNSWMNSTKVVYIDDVVPDESGNVYLDFSTTEDAMYGFNAGVIIQDYTQPDNVSEMTINNNVVASQAALAPDEATGRLLADSLKTGNAKFYPNPFTDFLNIDFNNTSAANRISMEVYDLSGRMSYRRILGALPAGANTLRLSAAEANMGTGVYIITLSVDGKAVLANKVLRTRN